VILKKGKKSKKDSKLLHLVNVAFKRVHLFKGPMNLMLSALKKEREIKTE
jgi:hypothetical protein